MNQQNLSSFIWSVADLLRGDYKQADYGKVILPFTVLRRMVQAPERSGKGEGAVERDHQPGLKQGIAIRRELTVLDVIAKLEPYLQGLKLYCRSLVGNDWEAEDLMQDVLTKALHAFWRSPDRSISRSFLFRIAKNAWIDRCRAERKRRGDTTFDEDYHQSVPFAVNEWLARELLEQLAESLNPRQMVLVILIDAFAFSAAESAELLRMTEGAVKEGLKRARRRLHSLMAGKEKDIVRNGKSKRQAGSEMTPALFETFVAGFRKGDAGMICRAYLSLAAQGVTIEKVSQEEGRYSFTLRDPDGHLLEFFQNI